MEKKKIVLQGRNIPKDESGDPRFKHLGIESELPSLEYDPLSVLQVFEPWEVVELVNRALYQLLYQKEAHKDRAQRLRDETAPIRKKVKEMFNVSWMKATPEQIEKAAKAVKEQGMDI